MFSLPGMSLYKLTMQNQKDKMNMTHGSLWLIFAYCIRSTSAIADELFECV